MEWTYTIEGYYGKAVIAIDDPIFSHGWYLKTIKRNGEYEWTSNPLYARTFTAKTALKHLEALKAGADKGWESYHNAWKEYYESFRVETVPFVLERGEALNENAELVLQSEGVNYRYVGLKLGTESHGQWFPVEFRKTAEHVEGAPIYTVTFHY